MIPYQKTRYLSLVMGSNINTNQFFNLQKIFTKIIVEKEISSVLDMPCGDFLWFYEIIKNKNIDLSWY